MTIAACGDSGSRREASSSSERSRSSADGRVPDRPLEVSVRFHALGMPAKVAAATDYVVDKKALALALDAARPPLVACYSGRPLSTESSDGPAATWVTMRVSDKGEPANAKAVRSNAPEASGKCAADVLGRISFAGQKQPFALSVWLEVSPKEARAPEGAEPVGSSGPDAEASRLPPGSCASDNVLAYLPACSDPARGGMWGDEIGDVFGGGGLGLSGAGSEGEIGLGSIGTRSGGQGLGGEGPLSGKHRAKPPQVRMGATSVSGRLPAEVIQRIVRQNFGRFRLCYENALRTDPTLGGTVTVSFVIAPDGTVSGVSHTTTMPEPSTGACVEKAFTGLSFPQPEGGVVKVTYPISFSPGDTPVKKVSAILGVDLPQLNGSGLAAAVTRDKAFAASVDGDAGADVPFVVFVDVLGDHYAVVRVPKAAASPSGIGLFGDDFNVFVVPAGRAKPKTTFLE